MTESLKETTTTDQTWRDVTETWQATLALLKSVEVERGRAVLQCIASDEELLKALGMAEALYKAAGDVPIEVVVRLNDGAGAHIRTHAYKYDKLISQELVRIRASQGHPVARVDACRLGPGRRHDWHGQPALSALLRRAAVRGQPPGCASPSWRGGAGARDGALLLHLLPSHRGSLA